MRVQGIFSAHGVDNIVLNYTAERMGIKKEGDYIEHFINDEHKQNCYKAMDKLSCSVFVKSFENSMCAYEDMLIYAVEEIV